MKLNMEQNEQLNIVREYRKVVDFVLMELCKLQEQDILRQSAKDKDSLSYYKARYEGAQKIATDFRNLLKSEPSK